MKSTRLIVILISAAVAVAVSFGPSWHEILGGTYVPEPVDQVQRTFDIALKQYRDALSNRRCIGTHVNDDAMFITALIRMGCLMIVCIVLAKLIENELIPEVAEHQD